MIIKPIKVNRWNFMSFVPNVASIEMAPLWPYDTKNPHWVGVWIPMVNGFWVSLISLTSWEKNTSPRCWRSQVWIEIIGLVCKRQLLFLCFWSKYARSWSWMKSFCVMLCCNPSLGLVTKTRACKGANQEWSPRVTFHVPKSVGECEGMNPHTPKWTPIWGVGVSIDSWIFREPF